MQHLVHGSAAGRGSTELLARRHGDVPTSGAVIPQQRRSSDRPVEPVVVPRAQPLQFSSAQERARRPGLSPDCARLLLCGVLLFGAMVSQLGGQPPASVDPGRTSQHLTHQSRP